MTIRSFLTLALTVMALMAAPLNGAKAAVVTLTLPLPGVVNADGTAITGAYDISSSIAPGEVVAGVTVTADAFSPFGGSNEQIKIALQNPGYTPYAFLTRRTFEGTFVTDTYESDFETQIQTDTVQDELLLSSGVDSVSALVGTTTETSASYEINSFMTGSERFGYTYFFLNEAIENTGYWGNVTTAPLTLSAATLAQVNATGEVPYSISALVGQFDPVLTFEVTLAPAVSGTIPEPGTWSTMILGFAAMGGALRSRRTQRRTAA